MEKHDVQIVEVHEHNTFKGKNVEYVATYEYCELTEEYLATEEMITENDIAMKNAYREQNHLLTTQDIIGLRNKYEISQKDLASLLGWGEKTITRYEGHQVQDMAHDFVLRKIDGDPEWFLELLENGKTKVSQPAYERYKARISKAYEEMQDEYLRKSILAQYVQYQNFPDYCGDTKLNFNKIVDVIRYFSNSDKMSNLYKVKLMKLLWYADFLAFKKYNHSLTGMVYTAMPMGAVPIAHKSIIELKGISYEEIEFENGIGYRFIPSGDESFHSLSQEDIGILDTIVNEFGEDTKEQIVCKMHEEIAYKETQAGSIIDYKYAKALKI